MFYMNFIVLLCYVFYLILCLLLMFAVILIYDFLFNKNFINDIMLHKIQTIIITLTLSATILKFFVEMQEKYNLVPNHIVLIVVILLLLFISYLTLKYNFNNTAKSQKRKYKNKK